MQDTSLLNYLDGLYRYAIVLSGSRSEAEDLVQETYIRAVKKVKSLRPESNIKGWLFTVLRNIWLNQLRKNRNSPPLVEIDATEEPADIQGDTSTDPHAAHISMVKQQQVREAINQLPVHFREVIVLREYEEMSYQDIARMLGRPVGTVMSRLARARDQLRVLLSETNLFSASPK